MAVSDDVCRFAFERSERGLAVVSLPDARFVEVNERFCTFAGRNRDEISGSQWSLIAGMHDMDLIKSKIEAYASQLGGPFCCDVSVQASFDCDTSPCLVLIEVQDVTERRSSERQAKLRAEEMEAVLDAVPAAIWLAHDATGGRISGNNVSREWLKMPHTASFLASDTRLQEMQWLATADTKGNPLDASDIPIMRAARGEKVDNFLGQIILSDGQRRHIFGNARPLFGADGKPRGAVSAFIDITDHMRAEARQHLLAREVDHRARNILSVVQAIIQLTKAPTVDVFRQGLTGRIGSLARVHTLISDSQWSRIDLCLLVTVELTPFGLGQDTEEVGSRISISGPDVRLTPPAAQALSLVLHELATNAAKYGALTSPKGKIRVDWDWTGERNDTFSLCWREYDGQPAMQPDTNGFGGTLIRTSIEDQLNGKVSYRWLDDGLKVELSCPVGDVTDTPPVTHT